MDAHQEVEVARGLAAGDARAWRAFYQAHCQALWRFVGRRMGPGEADVADVVQETFLAAARSAARYDPRLGTLWAWLCGIARHHVAQFYRSEERQSRIRRAEDQLSGRADWLDWLEGRESLPDDVLAAAELGTLVRAILSELPVDYELVLVAKYVDGATADEIARQLGCTHEAARSRLARARQAFRAAFLKRTSCVTDSPAGGPYER